VFLIVYLRLGDRFFLTSPWDKQDADSLPNKERPVLPALVPGTPIAAVKKY
jgi:hypothetical protein